MRVYFLAERTCALSVNGIYLGMADGFERMTELDPKDGVFCELKPCGYLPVGFTFDEEFLLSPPPQVRLYYTDGAVAVYGCGFYRADPSLKVLWQERLGNTLLTLCLQGKLQLNLENETGFHIVPLPDDLETCKAVALGKCFLLEGERAFALLARNGEKLVVSEGRVLERGETLKAEIPFHDSMGHTAVCAWTEGKLTDCAVRSAREPNETTFALALFESALIGADCTPFLHSSLAEKASTLREYLGDYCSVVLTNEHDRVGLVYQRKERIYDVRYFRVTVEEGKVSNIKPE